jgi:hypothetical protein
MQEGIAIVGFDEVEKRGMEKGANQSLSHRVIRIRLWSSNLNLR